MFAPIKPLCLSHVLRVAQLSYNLLSAKQLFYDNNYSVVFYYDFVCFKDNVTGNILLQAPSISNVYPVCLSTESPLVPANLVFSSSGAQYQCRLGHCAAHILAILNVSTVFKDNCTTCHLAKSHRVPFTLIVYCTPSCFE